MDARTIAAVETKHCANSTDGGLPASNHRIAADGFCTICDRGARTLAMVHGI